MEAQLTKDIELERFAEFKEILRIISIWMALPIFFVFWISDVIYVPEYKWRFLAIRSLVIPICFAALKLIPKLKTFRASEWLALFFVTAIALLIHFMIFTIGDFSTAYYAGLNLIALGGLTFIPWTRMFFFLATLAIYLPYYIGASLWIHRGHSATAIIVNSFFISCTVVIAYIVRTFQEDLRRKELASRLALEDEVRHRDKIIRTKTKESVALEMAIFEREFLSDIARRVSHDIRSPLSALNLVMGSVEIPETKKSLILEASRRVSDIANEFLTMSKQCKPASLRAPTALSDIASAISEIVIEKKVHSGDTKLQFQKSIDFEERQAKAEIELLKLKRVLSNILNNAIEAMPDGGVLKVQGSTEADKLIIKVTDTGIGIPREILPKLASEGFSYKKEDGNGLGLFMAKKDVERWGGFLDVESQHGQGTTVSIQIPIT